LEVGGNIQPAAVHRDVVVDLGRGYATEDAGPATALPDNAEIIRVDLALTTAALPTEVDLARADLLGIGGRRNPSASVDTLTVQWSPSPHVFRVLRPPLVCIHG
jgi:hypothetical protein